MTGSKPTRRERAARTRLRILRCAHAAFVARGYTGTRMVDVAAEAGVAVQTVYFTFHIKSELLAACYDLAVLGAHDAPPPVEQEWHIAMTAAATPAESIGHFVRGNTAICDRVAVLDDMVRATLHEPEAVAVHELAERHRRRDFEKIVGRWAKKFGLRPGLTKATCADLLLTYASPSNYRQLVVDYRWSREDYTNWLRGVIIDLVATPHDVGDAAAS